MTRVLVHADDLSGAAEVAALLHAASGHTTLHLSAEQSADDGVTVIDLDTRWLAAADAETRARAALAIDDRVLFTKIDSLLRGNVAAHVRALDPEQHPVVFASALPAAGRTVIDGVPLVNGNPLSTLAAWSRESHPAPTTVIDALGNIPARLADLATVRRGARALVAPGTVAVCDAETDADLDLLVDATWDLPGIRYVGAGGLAAALARRLTSTPPPGPPSQRTNPVLFVVGTAEPAALDQLDALAETVDTTHITIPAETVDSTRGTTPADHLATTLTPYVDAAAASLRADRSTTLRVAGSGSSPEAVVAALATAAAQLVASGIELDLVLTGGHTARAVLDALGIGRLTVAGDVHHGAVLLSAPDGRRIVTRPGSFGDRSSFAAIHAALRSPQSRKVSAS